MSIALARAHSNLTKLIVQDYKHTVEEGARQLPSDLSDRVEFLPHNFFELQPTAGADVYIMRHICHNWSTENSAKILRQLIPVMKPTSKILLVEVVVLPSGMEESSVAERYMRYVVPKLPIRSLSLSTDYALLTKVQECGRDYATNAQYARAE